MKVAVVEDEVVFSEKIKSFIERFSLENGKNFDVVYYDDGDCLTENYKADYDLIILDINLKRVDGMTAAQYVRKLDKNVIIIFITNLSSYAVDGYKVNASAFILKPINYFAFAEELKKAVRAIENKSESVLITDKRRSFRISKNEILYVECNNHMLTIHTLDNEITTRCPLKDFMKLLGNNFFACNSGYVVNLKYVDEVLENVAIVGGQNVIISRMRRKAFLDALTRYCGGLDDD